MAKKEARNQKRLAKQKAKRAEKRTQLARRNSTDPTIRLASASEWPIIACTVPVELWENGIGNLFIARRVAAGRVAIAGFLVDTYCLGVKNAFWRIASEGEYLKLLEKNREHGDYNKVAPEYFSKLVHCAADYAQSFGFPPHPDFRNARLMLDGIDPSMCHDEFAFGQDGKPYYVSGPNESAATAQAIVHRVQAAGGHFLVRVAGSPNDEPGFAGEDARLLDDDFDDDDDEFDDDPE